MGEWCQVACGPVGVAKHHHPGLTEGCGSATLCGTQGPLDLGKKSFHSLHASQTMDFLTPLPAHFSCHLHSEMES